MTKIFSRACRKWFPIFLALGCTITVAYAQGYPTKPVRIIVPVTAGTTGDTLVRAVSVKLAERWGQPVIVDNRPGANTQIGAEAAAKSAADGYTLLFTTEATLVSNPALYRKLPYDPAKDFEPVTMLFSGALMLVVNSTVSANTLPELIALAKSKPGVLAYASSGNGSVLHINFELLKRSAGIDVLHVPYKGAGPMITDFLGGQVSMTMLPDGFATPFVRGGKIRAIAVDLVEHSTLFPSVPNYAEAGLPQHVPLTAWGALVAPAGTPKDITAKINADVAAILKLPDVRAAYAAQGTTPIGNSPAEFSQIIKTETAKWAKGVKDSGAQLD